METMGAISGLYGDYMGDTGEWKKEWKLWVEIWDAALRVFRELMVFSFWLSGFILFALYFVPLPLSLECFRGTLVKDGEGRIHSLR